MTPQLLAVYLFVLKVLKTVGASAQTVTDAISELGAAVVSGDVSAIADAAAALIKSLVPIIQEFKNQAAPHFAAHTNVSHEVLNNRVLEAEKEFHGLFGGGGGGGKVLENLKNLLPTIITILQLFGVKLPVGAA